jgi:hypothetical protein
LAPPKLLIAPAEGADAVVDALAELGVDVELARADPVPEGDGPAAIAAAISGYEAGARRIAPAAAIVHGSGDRALAAAISLAKLAVPVARVAETGDDDLTGLVAGHTIAPGGTLAEQVRDWLHDPHVPAIPGSGSAGISRYRATRR